MRSVISAVWCLLALLVASPSVAASPAFSVDALGSTVYGPIAVRDYVLRCRTRDRSTCSSGLKRFLKGRLHPLTRAAILVELAGEARAAGDREAGERLVEELGFLKAFMLEMPGGEPVLLHADPVSGLVAAGDSVALSTDIARRFVTSISSPGATAAWVLVSGAYLEQVCLDDDCASVGPMTRRFLDQFAFPVRLGRGTSHTLALAFSPEASTVQFRARLATTGWHSLRTTPVGDDGAAGSRITGRLERKQTEESREASILGWIPPFDAVGSVGEQLAQCHAQRLTGGNPSEAAEALLAADEDLAASDWESLIGCLVGDVHEYEAVRQARRLYPDERVFVLAEADYRARQQQVRQAYKLLTSLGRLPDLEGFSAEERVVAADILRSLLPTMGLRYLLLDTLRQAHADSADARKLVVSLAEVLVEQERYREAVDALTPFVQRWPGDTLAVNTLAYMLERLGRYDEQARILERLSWLSPTRTLLLDTLAEARERAGDIEGARALYLTISEKGRFVPYLLNKAAGFFMRTGDLEMALQLWEQVARQRPQEREVRALLRRLRAASEPQEAPLATDEEVLQLSDDLPDFAGYAVQGIVDRTRIRLYGNGAHLLRRIQAVRVQPEGESRSFTFRFTYDSHLEEALVVRAERLGPDGTVAPASEYGDVSLSGDEYNLYYDLRQMVVRYDDLTAGEILILTYEIEASPSTLGGPFSGVAWFQEDYPKSHAELAIELPANRELHSTIGPPDRISLVTQGIDDGETGRTWRFTIDTVPAESSEPFPPGPYERSLYVHYSTLADWRQFAQWYTGVIDHVGGLDTAMKRLVEDVQDGAAGSREVAERIARHVADEIRYVGLELGVHGLRPYAPQQVFGRGFGDCKDKSLLYVSLLRAVGIPANLVVVPTMPRGKVPLDPGSPSIFNHAIVYLPEWDLFFDPTARYLGLGILPWQNQGASAIVIDGDKSREVVLPVAPHEKTVARFELMVGPGEDEFLAVQGTLTFSGQFAWRLLGAMEQQGSWRNTVESYVSSVLPVVSVVSTEERVERGDDPAVIVTFEGQFKPAGQTVQLMPDGNSAFALVKRPQRTQPLVFGYPYEHDFDVRFAPGTLRFPAGHYNAAQNDEAAYEVAVDEMPDGGQLVRVRFEQRARRVPADSYATFRTIVVQYQEALARLQGRQEAP